MVAIPLTERKEMKKLTALGLFLIAAACQVVQPVGPMTVQEMAANYPNAICEVFVIKGQFDTAICAGSARELAQKEAEFLTKHPSATIAPPTASSAPPATTPNNIP